MQGFKSFADRTKLTFEDGVTAIVGPNGSGKSNVSDAIKWVFGEQSVKSLRGSKMEDVIFGGTLNRKPQGFTKVSVTIDNTSHSIDMDSDEVTVTRKLYRSGDSEYKINGNSVRLKDVHELFMDTGLGRDGYSVIEQGKIADIVSQKGTERRDIFEEAAGISRFRYRKAEAEHKLDGAEENLLRLKDIMTELESRVEPLRIQAEKAKEFLTLMDERKSLEISLWVKKLENLSEQIKELDDRILVNKTEKESIENQLGKIEEDIENCEKLQQEYLVYFDTKRNFIKNMQESIFDMQTKTAVMQNDIAHNKQMAEMQLKELEKFGQSSEETQKELENKKIVIAKQKEELSHKEAEYNRISADEDRLKSQKLDEKAKLNVINANIEELKQSIAKAQIEKETSGTLIEETKERLETLKKSSESAELIAKLEQELKDAKFFAEDLEENIQTFANSTKGYEYKVSSKREALEEIQTNLRAYEKKASEKLQHAQLLSDMEKNMDGYSGSVKHIIAISSQGSALRGVYGTASSLIDVDKKYALAIEIAMGQAMQNIVVDNENTAKKCISILKSSNNGRATFLPISTLVGSPIDDENLFKTDGFVNVACKLVKTDEKYRGVIDWLLGRIIIAEDIDSAIIIGKAVSHKYKVVSLDGQVVNAGGSLTGGSTGKSGNILSRKSEIELLRAEAKEIAEEMCALEEKENVLLREIAEIDAVVLGINSEKRTAEEDLISANAECKRIKMSLDEARERDEKAYKETEKLANRIKELENQGLNSIEMIDKLNDELQNLNEKYSLKQNNLQLMTEQIEDFNEKESNLQLECVRLEKDIESSQSAIDIFTQRLKMDIYKKEETEQSVKRLNIAIEDLEKQIEENIKNIADGKVQITETQAEIDNKRTEQESTEQKISELRKTEKIVAAKREEIAMDFGRNEEKRLSLQSENDDIVGKMWDDYEVLKSEALEIAIEIEDVQKANKRLSELKNHIKSMGSVNVSAIDEYAEVYERYTFMSEQIADVENAKAKLLELISQLSTDMCNMFTEKFNAINNNFKEIFKELFGGGTGELLLDDPQNPLESNIEIFVQPPGKIIKNLASLSGGEQAMVAICIYFAILKVSPAPFVLIDEIEAALDDVNVVRFATYLNKLTDNTQFISITHRRGTMEQADVLYGVTMEEKGVSKLLRLNIGEMEEKLKMQIN